MNRHKTIRTIFIFFLLIIQVVFISEILKENTHSLGIVASMIILSILVLITHLRGEIHHKDHAYEHVLVALWIPAGAFVTFYLNHFLKLGPVLSAAITGSAASFIPNLRKQSHYLQQLPAAIYCGAFIGMSSAGVAPNFLFITTASIFTAILLIISKNLFAGVGGKLGTLAFAGVAITSFLYFLISSYV
ncbi:hypothetical protein SAMN06265348_101520 [Pedobacter westerhofensis]|uniref:Uncharacterized protein n=1 Tax=Pedobacter westerhofensis TaxID=425512 RepID=A0A521AX94_9SPHI|nr:hypothetical protein [Pedobacter westerhofensis]SMO39458.1 hypothetical protein SAMN06265348_101520 [Pedobacter westerhofensis]